MRRVLSVVCLVGAALACAVACAAARDASEAAAQQQSSTKVVAAKPTPEVKSVASEAAPKVTEIKEDELKSLLGANVARERPLLVNFWATWCVPCREEFPDLVKIREQYAASRLDFVTVSLDDPSDIEKAVPEFLRDAHATQMPAYLLHAADEGTAINSIDATWQGELPATFLYDRQGQLVFKHKGRVKPAELRAAVEQVLSAKLDAPAQQQ
jgi:thiol-disulfide isomerase/thioredoxin